MEGTVRISVAQYASLLRKEDKLNALDIGGVNNWEWYDDALREDGYYERLEADRLMDDAKRLHTLQSQEQGVNMSSIYGLEYGYILMSIVQSYAPDSKAQEICANAYQKALEDGMSDNQINLMFAQMLVDGILYGNWPWVTI